MQIHPISASSFDARKKSVQDSVGWEAAPLSRIGQDGYKKNSITLISRSLCCNHNSQDDNLDPPEAEKVCEAVKHLRRKLAFLERTEGEKREKAR